MLVKNVKYKLVSWGFREFGWNVQSITCVQHFKILALWCSYRGFTFHFLFFWYLYFQDCWVQFSNLSNLFPTRSDLVLPTFRARHIKRRLYNAFILPAFNYCSDVWHFCSKRSKDKLEQLNKKALRTVLNSNLDYETLLRITGSVNLESSRVQNMLVTTYKILYEIAPPWKNEQRRTTSEVLKNWINLELLQPAMDYNRSDMLLLKYGIRCLIT